MKLQNKIILPLLFILTAPIAVMSGVAYRYILNFTSNSLAQNSQELAYSITPSLNQNFKTVENNLRLFTSNRLFQDYISRGDERFDLIQTSILKQFANYQKVHPEYVSIKLVLANGEIDSVVDSRENPEFLMDIADWPIYKDLVANQDGQMETHLEQLADGTHIMHFGIPVHTQQPFSSSEQAPPKPQMYLVLTKVLMHAKNIIISVDPEEGHKVFLTDKQDKIVFANKETIEGQQMDFSQTELLSNGLLVANVESRPFYLFRVPLSHEFIMYVGLPKNKFNESADALALTMTIITLVLIGMIFAFCFLYLRQVLLSPIYANKQLVEDITQGKMDTTLTKELCNDELSLLTKSILKMRDTIVNNQENIEQLAYFDNLTGLPNRFTFQQELTQAVEQSKSSKKQFALVFLDLDNFKYVNDNLGHDIGDELLKIVSKRIRKNLRIQDYVVNTNKLNAIQNTMLARIGGDEFTLILNDFKSANAIATPLNRVIAALQAPIHINGHTMHVGASLGVAVYPQHASNEKELLKCADMAMYEAKRRGKNCFVFYEEELKEELMA